MNAYQIKTSTASGKCRAWVIFAGDREQAKADAERMLPLLCPAAGEYVSECNENRPADEYEAGVYKLASLLQTDTEAHIRKDYAWSADTGNWFAWHVRVKPGRKYVNVDIGGSGKYMVTPEGEIYGIKAYGVIHRGHFFGTLATVNNYYWGEYAAVPRGVPIADTIKG